MADAALPEVAALTAEIASHRGTVPIIRDVSFAVASGECFGLVGESGSGKSMTVKAILWLLPQGARVSAEARDLLRTGSRTEGEAFRPGQDRAPDHRSPVSRRAP